jgi:hypothetical protein
MSSISCDESITMINVVVLQNWMGCVEGETGSCSAACVTCAVDGTEKVSIKVEEEFDIKYKIPEVVASPAIKTEHEVRLRLCVRWWQIMFLRPLIATKM